MTVERTPQPMLSYFFLSPGVFVSYHCSTCLTEGWQWPDQGRPDHGSIVGQDATSFDEHEAAL